MYQNEIEKIKICFFGCFYPEISGGAEYQTYLISNSLCPDKYDPFFISLSLLKDTYEVIDGNRVHFFKKKKSIFNIDKGYILNYIRIKEIIEKEKPKVIYQRMSNSATGILAYLAPQLGYKFIWACASKEDLSPLRRSIFKPKSWLEDRLRIYGIRKADTILLQSLDQQLELGKNFGLIGRVLKNGHPEYEGTINNEFKLKKIVFIGNFKKIKQPDVFVMLSRYFEERDDCKFLMIGRDSSNKYYNVINSIENKKNLEWLGEIPNDEVNNILSSTYLLVNTSLYEGFANTFIQAWLRGVPVLSLHVNPDSLLNNQGLGLCSGNFTGLCSDLEFLLNNQNFRKEMSKRCREYAEKEHSLINISTKFEEIIEKLVREK